MQGNHMAMLKYTALSLLMTVASISSADDSYAPQQGVLPPPGPYMSSRPVLSPAPEQNVQTQVVQPQMPMAKPYSGNSAMAPAQPMPMQPMHGYNQGFPPYGYSQPMPYGNAMQNAFMPYRYNQPQPNPWQQQPYYGPQQGGWRW